MAISVGDGLFNRFPSPNIPPLSCPSIRALRVFLTRTFERPVFPVRRLLTRSTQDAPKLRISPFTRSSAGSVIFSLSLVVRAHAGGNDSTGLRRIHSNRDVHCHPGF